MSFPNAPAPHHLSSLSRSYPTKFGSSFTGAAARRAPSAARAGHFGENTFGNALHGTCVPRMGKTKSSGSSDVVIPSDSQAMTE